jgi:hypothetical protein
MYRRGGYTSTLGSFAARETATLQISNLNRSVQNEEEDEDDETPFPVYVGGKVTRIAPPQHRSARKANPPLFVSENSADRQPREDVPSSLPRKYYEAGVGNNNEEQDRQQGAANIETEDFIHISQLHVPEKLAITHTNMPTHTNMLRDKVPQRPKVPKPRDSRGFSRDTRLGVLHVHMNAHIAARPPSPLGGWGDESITEDGYIELKNANRRMAWWNQVSIENREKSEVPNDAHKLQPGNGVFAKCSIQKSKGNRRRTGGGGSIKSHRSRGTGRGKTKQGAPRRKTGAAAQKLKSAISRRVAEKKRRQQLEVERLKLIESLREIRVRNEKMRGERQGRSLGLDKLDYSLFQDSSAVAKDGAQQGTKGLKCSMQSIESSTRRRQQLLPSEATYAEMIYAKKTRQDDVESEEGLSAEVAPKSKCDDLRDVATVSAGTECAAQGTMFVEDVESLMTLKRSP